MEKQSVLVMGLGREGAITVRQTSQWLQDANDRTPPEISPCLGDRAVPEAAWHLLLWAALLAPWSERLPSNSPILALKLERGI